MAFLTYWELSNDVLLKLNSFLFWAIMYLYVAIKSPNQSAEYCSRLITLLHGSVATIVGLTHCNLRTLSLSSFNARTEPRHFALMLWSWGYFAFDLIWCLASWTESSLMLCHHISALIAITLYLRKTHTGCTFGCTIAMLECTNPLLQTRWLLRNEGHDKTWLFHIIEIVYLVMFMFLRGVVGSYIVYKVITTDAFHAEDKILTLVFYTVSVFFMHEIIGYVFHRYKKHVDEIQVKCIEWLKSKCPYEDVNYYYRQLIQLVRYIDIKQNNADTLKQYLRRPNCHNTYKYPTYNETEELGNDFIEPKCRISIMSMDTYRE